MPANARNVIVLSADPKGHFIEGTISGTPKPGTLMQVQVGTAPKNGRLTYEVYAPAAGDGSPREVIVLREDDEQGKTVDDAYVSGTRGFMYIPCPGDEIQVRRQDITGTGTAAEDISSGERLLIVDGTGKVSPVAIGVVNAAAVYPFVSLENYSDPPAESLIPVRVSMF